MVTNTAASNSTASDHVGQTKSKAIGVGPGSVLLGWVTRCHVGSGLLTSSGPSHPSRDRRVTERFGHYELLELVGRGGMGEVYRAVDTTRDRVVALKRMPAHLAGDADFQARFRRESRLAARLREPHIIPIHDFGEIDGQLFIDMRLVEGVDLGGLLTGHGALSPERAVRIVAQVASALDAAHAEGLVHRDVKPSNILITGADREQDFVYLVDFGIARAAAGSGSGATSLTSTGATVGTLDYIAPERFLRGYGDHRVDVYALGCVLYESLTGSKPFPGDGLLALMYAHVNTPPPRPSQYPGITSQLDEVVARAMAKDPDVRYSSAGELAVVARAALRAPAGDVTVRPLLGLDLPSATAVPATDPNPPPPADAPAPPTVRPPEPRPERSHRRRRAQNSIIAAGVAVLLGATWIVTEQVPPTNAPNPVSPRTSTAPTQTPSAMPTYTLGPAVPVGRSPGQIAVTSDGGRVLVTNSFSYSVSVVDTATNKVSAEVRVGHAPLDVAIAPDGRAAYVTNSESASVSVLDLTTNTVAGTITVGGRPFSIAMAPDGRNAYVVNLQLSKLQIVDLQSRTVSKEIDLSAPTNVAVAPDGKRAYVSSRESKSIFVIDTATDAVVATIADQSGPDSLKFSPDGRTAYVVHPDAGTVGVVDTSTGTFIGSIPVGEAPYDVAFSPDGQYAYVPNLNSNTVSAIDVASSSVITSIPVDGGPSGVVVAPNSGAVYVSSDTPGALYTIHLKSA